MSADGTAPARPRGRPRAFDREAALAKATRLFWLKGYEATSISDLTEAMGIGSPSLYAAFGSKESLYLEALSFYADHYGDLVWGRYSAAATARQAVECLLLDSAVALTDTCGGNPPGCMVTLSSAGCGEHAELDARMRSARAAMLDRLEARIGKAVAEGELPASTDVQALARFVQTVQSGMSILARDGAGRSELEAVARIAMLGWDTHTRNSDDI
ncbi:MAG TPA: TetR/AcrR family transcriptional regulator [Geminicoccus sp.]|uniref:TetR/AcrR family transcriptional regulator n=1 Tax=Geminicoccus sp. TaxID=2024832 RepID=UPI002BF09BE1|nr:TetR/AcrR family transcriptional regulator [Geminicoccus sp.]HWL67185.1 TetR/AcrR family transcriptional regulator [Geminicoccus sp.]